MIFNQLFSKIFKATLPVLIPVILKQVRLAIGKREQAIRLNPDKDSSSGSIHKKTHSFQSQQSQQSQTRTHHKDNVDFEENVDFSTPESPFMRAAKDTAQSFAEDEVFMRTAKDKAKGFAKNLGADLFKEMTGLGQVDHDSLSALEKKLLAETEKQQEQIDALYRHQEGLRAAKKKLIHEHTHLRKDIARLRILLWTTISTLLLTIGALTWTMVNVF